MTDATAPRPTDKSGFSSRWMLDSGARRDAAATTVAGDANATARAIDTDGDGVADTLAVRVDAERESVASRIGGWIARSIVTLLLVAALVAAAAAASAYVQAREELDRTTAMLETERGVTADARREAAQANDRVASLESDATADAADAAKVAAERDELALEVKVLRGMLLDTERERRAER